MTDDDLMCAVAQGDEGAFRLLYERYRVQAVNFFYRRTGDRQAAEDLFQDLFVRVFRAADQYRADGQFGRWFYTIASNLCRDYYRRQAIVARHQSHLEEHQEASMPADGMATEQDPAWHLERAAEAEMVRQALLQLPYDLREIVVMREYEGLSYDEISARLGVRSATLRTRMHRAMEELRNLLATGLLREYSSDM